MQRMTSVCRRLSSQVWSSLTMQTIAPNLSAFAASSSTTCKSTDAAEPKEEAQTTQQFSGHIPVEELEFSYSRSSGPGGQNVNKVSTKVEVRFHVPSASWIPQDIKSKLIELEHNRVTKEGYLVLTSDKTRKQMLNQADVMDKLRSIVFKAAAKPRGLTDQEIQLRDKRLAKSKEETLREKRQRSMKKQSRGSPSVGSV
ncbi:large ribosomal subunit protein mL62-like isoform X2 [Littorina saxatilis]|uniref:large ribosomal subunit protein mL62-like isoform X2 n=1 Tax=Littorina saxatilis TaxID=31220 RepID=UPI0038B47D0F